MDCLIFGDNKNILQEEETKDTIGKRVWGGFFSLILRLGMYGTYSQHAVYTGMQWPRPRARHRGSSAGVVVENVAMHEEHHHSSDLCLR